MARKAGGLDAAQRPADPSADRGRPARQPSCVPAQQVIRKLREMFVRAQLMERLDPFDHLVKVTRDATSRE